MNLSEKIDTDLVAAMKSGESLVRDTLRMVKTTIKNAEIQKGHELTNEEIIDVLSKEIKQRQEAAASYLIGNRPELVEKENAEITILKQYLPQQLSETEIRQLVDETINELNASKIADMSKVMALLMPKVKGKADGNLVSRLVRETLSA